VARCSVLVLSEDSGEGAHDTLATLAKKMFLFIDPACQSHHIRFEPPTSEGAKQALRGNLWKSQEPRDQPKRRDLIGYLATKLFEGPTSFVFFHIDGDRAWSARGESGSESENVRKFKTFIEREVLQFVELRRKRLAETRSQGLAGEMPAHTPDMQQLVLAVPYYSIEAWLFQNIELAKELCTNHPRCRGAHIPLLEGWARDRGSLDEVLQPKEAICFRDGHNRELAGAGFPTEAVYDARKSFAETVDGLLECPMLLAALDATHRP
jgi:hypothetical protein